MSSTDPSDTFQYGSSSGNGPVPSFNETNLEQWKRDLFVYLTFYEAEAGLYEPSPDLSDDELWEHSKKSKKAFSVMARSAKPNAEANSVCDAYVQDCIERCGTPCPRRLFAQLDEYFCHSAQDKREATDRAFKNLKMDETDNGKVQNFMIRFERVTKEAEICRSSKYSEHDKIFQLREGL